MKCPKCNEKLKEESIICPNCGNKIEIIKKEEKEDTTGYGVHGIIIGISAITSALIILSIKSQLPIKNFFLIYLGIFAAVYLFIGLIYIIFFKR